MHHTGLTHRATGRRMIVAVWTAILTLGLFVLLSQGPAAAAPSPNCGPFNVSVAHGGSITIDASMCDGPDDFGIGTLKTAPAHGTVSIDTIVTQSVTYTHFGGSDTATSDSFVFDDGLGNDVQVNVTIGAAATITISPSTLPAATVASPYSETISASGGTAPYTFAVTAGALPSGLSLSSAGTLSGTPTAGGTFNFTVTATDAGSVSGARAYTLTVAAPAMTLPSTALADGTVGTAYSGSVNAATGGTAPYTYALTSGALPSGLALGATDGQITGTPTASGTFNFTVTATDSSTGTGPYTASNSYAITIAEAIPVANPVSATVAYGSGANPVNLNITGGTATSVSVAIAPLHGTAIASGTTITYQPDAGYAGADSFTYTATNGTGTSAPATVSLTVSDPTLSIAAGGALTAQIGTAYSQTFSVSGGAAPYSIGVTGLPAGLAVTGTSTTSVTVSGTPSESGSFGLTVTATDSSTGTGPFSAAQPFTLTVSAPTIAISPSSGTLNLTYATAFNQSFSASGGTAPYSFSLTGTLPTGLSFDAATATLSGTPVQAGTFAISVTAEDSSSGTGAPFSDTTNYVLQVGAPTIAIDPATLPNATAGTAYSAALSASGGVGPYGFALTAGTLPAGLTLSSAGVLSGAPTESGTFGLTVTATDANGQTGARAYSLTVGTGGLSISPTTLPAATAGVAYSQALTASGGVAPYSFSVTGGALPAGVSLSASGLLSGTPASAGSFNFDVTVTDATGGTPSTATVSYTLAVSSPTITVTPATLANGVVGQSYSQSLAASGGTAPYSFSVGAGTLPAGLSLAAGGEISGTPTAAGTYGFTVVATDAQNFTGSVTYSVTVADAVPVANPDSATAVAGQSVTIDVTANDVGAISSIEIVQDPANGSAALSGNAIAYTPEASFDGTDTLTYRALGPAGSSSAVTVTIEVNPRPIPVSRRIDVVIGSTVTIDLAAGASGGPFTGASLISLSPRDAGSASLSGQQLTFTADPEFEGTATATFTLSNAFATSEPTAIYLDVSARPDPTLDPEVMGLLNAQTEATRRFATTQIQNFHQRLEALHEAGGRAEEPADGVSFIPGIALSFADTCRGRELASRDGECGAGQLTPGSAPFQTALAGEAAGQSAQPKATKVTIWTGGSINVGDRDGADGFEFETTGLSGGVDYRLSRDLAIGVGLGYGHDDSDVGSNGSRSKGDSYTAAIYGSYLPAENFFIDGLLGYQWLSFDSKRYVTSTGDFAFGERDGEQWFASISAGGLFDVYDLHLSPYARLDIARATLDAFTERGDPSTALRYGEQDITTTTGSLGVTMRYDQPSSFGIVSPELRLEYQHDFEGDSAVTMNYADIFSGPTYRGFIDGLDRDRFIIGVGANIRTAQDFAIRVEYRGMLGSEGDTDHGVLLNVSKQY